MIWLLAIFFSTLPLYSATVSGKVELRDSRDPEVRKRLDYSGVVVSVKPVHGSAPASGPSGAQERVTMLQKDKTFSPHVLAITVGTSVEFPNADPIFHNAFSSYNGQIFDVGLYPPGSTKSVRFKREGVVRVFCNIHASMSAVIVVLGTPYFATTGRDGSFAIPNVAAGDYQVQIFHERATEATLHGLERRVTVEQSPIVLPTLEISEAGFLPIPHTNKYGRSYPAESDEHSIYPAVRK
jgi:plastocyanin